jgi:cytidyltransferase-like protein
MRPAANGCVTRIYDDLAAVANTYDADISKQADDPQGGNDEKGHSLSMLIRTPGTWMRKILVMGLPGAGKTTLANVLAPLLNAVVFNADAVRANLSRDLGFSHEDRVEHARRMGWICDRVVEAGGTAIADFICPTEETRAAFGEAFTIWLDRISVGRFEDTNRMFVAPGRHDLRVSAEGTVQYWAEQALARLRPAFDPQKPTALFIGRYQPFHPGHQHLIEEGLRRVGQVCIAVGDTHGIDEKNPLSFFAVKQRIEAALSSSAGRFMVMPLPNITNVFFGRDVGYAVERIVLDEATEAISATTIRQLSTIPQGR